MYLCNGDIITLGHDLKELHNGLHALSAKKTYQCFLIGKVLLAMKNKDKKFMEKVKAVVKYRRSYVYFLIDFYNACVKYPKLKKVSISIGKIKCYFSFIKSQLEKEQTFWSTD